MHIYLEAWISKCNPHQPSKCTGAHGLILKYTSVLNISSLIGQFTDTKMSHNESWDNNPSTTNYMMLTVGPCGAAVHPLFFRFFYMAWPCPSISSSGHDSYRVDPYLQLP